MRKAAAGHPAGMSAMAPIWSSPTGAARDDGTAPKLQAHRDRARRAHAFAKALLDEAATLFLNGETESARLILRDLVNATLVSSSLH